MPQLNAKTVNSKEIWSSPDRSKTIYEVTIEANGQKYVAKTYSNKISQVGWSGTVETYEKEGRNGHETFLKQPQQEGRNYQGQSYQGKNSQPRSEFTMYLSYAKDLAVALINGGKSLDELPAIIEQVALEGKHLYSLREGAPDVSPTSSEPKYESIDDMDIKNELDRIFPEPERGEVLPL